MDGQASPETVVETEAGELERSIGLVGATSIGVGTMIGAGIFVFPGLAAGQAGPAAAASFALGGVVALLVALPTSELATAMPRSGGGYYFVSRGLGGLAGSLVGFGLWSGLIFASAFYLVGFGHYAVTTLAEFGIAFPGGVRVFAIAMGLGLTALSIFGTRHTASLQNVFVVLLLAILSVFLVWGILDAAGLLGRSSVPETFVPFGVMPIFTTAALVFTSYLGFAQVATIAGEVKRPSRNLPLAMVGSVILVAGFYVVTIVVSTSALGSDELARHGETAIFEVAQTVMGAAGGIAILVAGILATLSSANASILSSSRAIYALSRDSLFPKWVARVNRRFGTPHLALAVAGGPALLLIALGRTEVLAEVASLLHLIMYGLMCVALIALRRDPPDWYDPDFTSPGYPLIPILGAAASFGLIAFMRPASLLIGLIIAAAALAWHFWYSSNVQLKGVET